MPDLADRTTRSIFSKSVVAATTFQQSLRRRVVSYFRRFGTSGWSVGLGPWISEHLATLRDHLQHTLMSTWIEGFDWLWGKLPESIRGEVGIPNRPPIILPPGTARTPPIPPTITNRFSDGPEELRFLNIEEAAKRLFERRALTREQFDEANQSLRDFAFTVAGDLEVEAVEVVQSTLIEDLDAGTSFTSFVKTLEENLDTSKLGDGHLETVYRTNVQSAFRDGRETLASNPVVTDMFPYQEYIPIHDTRVRDEHEALGKLGLNGTGIYRRDDPVWDYFTPPWDFNCRCGVRLVTVEAAARAGVLEAKIWLASGRSPINPEHRFNFIPFPHNPGWGSRGRAGVFN